MIGAMAKILLVEDDEVLATMLVTEASQDHAISRVPDGGVALEMIKREQPDLMLLDLMMPRMSGFEVLEALRKDEKTASIPVIVLTNLSEESDIKRAKDLGARDVWVKANYSLGELHKKINEFCKGGGLQVGA